MIYLFGLSVALFLFLLILVKRGKKANYILLAWMGVVALHVSFFVILENGVAREYPLLLGLPLPLPILHGAFLYFYARSLIRPGEIRRRSILIHLIPFFLLVSLTIPFIALPASEKINVFEQQGGGFEWYFVIRKAGLIIAGVTYSLLVIVLIREHRKKILDNLSNVDRKMLTWLEYVAIGLAVIWMLSIFFDDQDVFTGVLLFVLFIGLFGINQLPVFYTRPNQDPRSVSAIDTPPGPQMPLQDSYRKYVKSKLSEEQAVQLMDRVEVVMRTQRPYTNPELTLNDLAVQMRVSPNDLSQVINSVSGRTFYHYINTYRIQEFLKRAESPASRRLTFLGLAYQCGFASKATFRKYFKLVTGKTPSAYFGVVMEEGAGMGREA